MQRLDLHEELGRRREEIDWDAFWEEARNVPKGRAHDPAYILGLRYRRDGRVDATLESIGIVRGISRERVHQLLKQYLAYLREPARMRRYLRGKQAQRSA